MIHKPRIAVVGSCVSRDAFNRDFAPNYKEEVELVADVYQSAVPSLGRESTVNCDIPPTVLSRYLPTLSKEFDGRNLERLVDAKPDFVVMDFYADVHFGVTKVDNQYTTRNHMAFGSSLDSGSFFNDQKDSAPDRMRFESDEGGSVGIYEHLTISALEKVVDRIRTNSPRARFIINSARFALLLSDDGSIRPFDDQQRLKKKNSNWNEIDALSSSIVEGERLVYQQDTLIAESGHQWGQNPVHYTSQYYDNFWIQLQDQLA